MCVCVCVCVMSVFRVQKLSGLRRLESVRVCLRVCVSEWLNECMCVCVCYISISCTKSECSAPTRGCVCVYVCVRASD